MNERTRASLFSTPRVRDWLMLASSFGMMIGGLWVLPRDKDVAIPVVTLFGGSACIASLRIWQKIRWSKIRPLSIAVVGGRPIRPSRTRSFVIGGSTLGVGIILLVYGQSAPISVQCCFWIIAASAALLLIATFAGLAPFGFVRFDPIGLTIGRRFDEYTMPWDSIGGVEATELFGHPALCLLLNDLDAVLVKPPSAGPSVLAALLKNLEWMGSHVLIMPDQYNLDLPLLLAAIVRFARDPAAREELRIPEPRATLRADDNR